MPLRLALALIATLMALAMAGCGGGSGDQTVSLGDETITVPGDTHGVYAELATILDQLPYRPWYTKCVVAQVEMVLSPAEAEELADLPEAEREEKAIKITSEAGPKCEAQHHQPVIDPHASSKELDLLRAGYATSMKSLAEANGADADQVACIEKNVEELPQEKVIDIGNGSKSVREGILLSIFKPCAKT